MTERDVLDVRSPQQWEEWLKRNHDVATEVCIRTDGDEGLFASYSDVRFTAPIRAGDVVEVVAQVVRVGTRSRTLELSCRVVCRGTPEAGDSAAQASKQASASAGNNASNAASALKPGAIGWLEVFLEGFGDDMLPASERGKPCPAGEPNCHKKG